MFPVLKKLVLFNYNLFIYFKIANEEECRIPDVSDITTKEQLISALNKELDILTEKFDKAIKKVREVSDRTQKRILKLKETLLEKNEQKYTRLCDEVLEMEEEFESANEPPKKKAKMINLQTIPDKLCFTKFDFDFLYWFFRKLIISYMCVSKDN